MPDYLGVRMKKLALVLSLIVMQVFGLQATYAIPHNRDFADYTVDYFPKNPNPEMTPGELCNTPSAYRYPEKIKYCDRNVSPEMKKEIIAEYDAEFGYRIQQMDRSKFKIDHLIPLCAGGANTKQNLWPQHESVYQITDRLEAEICAKMAEGKLMQRRAVELILTAKKNLDQADSIFQDVEAL